MSTPLLDYIRHRKEEKIRIREEKKEERRRREADRRKMREEERRRLKEMPVHSSKDKTDRAKVSCHTMSLVSTLATLLFFCHRLKKRLSF